MILSCPACQTTFVVSDAIFGTRPRRVRCSKCQHEWQALPAAQPEIPVDLTPPPVAPRPIPRGSNLPAARKEETLWEKHSSKAMGAVGAVLCLYLLASILGGAGIKVWPPSFLAADPMEVLALEDVKTRYEAQGANDAGDPIFVLVVEGMVRNTGSEPVAVPTIAIETKDKTGKVLASADASLQTSTLPPGQTGSFVQTFDNPPDDLADITVAFRANAGDHGAEQGDKKKHE